LPRTISQLFLHRKRLLKEHPCSSLAPLFLGGNSHKMQDRCFQEASRAEGSLKRAEGSSGLAAFKLLNYSL
jgi:hypothetical protein